MRAVLHRYRRSTSRRWLIACALSAVLAAQWLALLHGVLHVHGSGAVGIEHRWSGEPDGWARKVFAGHDAGSLACHLVDHVSQGGPSSSPLQIALPLAPAGGVAVLATPAVGATAWARYHARAPPVLA